VAQKNTTILTESAHPRIYCTDALKANFQNSLAQTEWKNKLIEKKKQNLEKYL